jgi:hypothetical protein
MEKAWDKSALIEDLKQQGLPLAEEAIAKVVKTTFAWADKSMEMSSGYFEQFGRPALAMVRKFVVAKIDEIDGEIQGRE